MAPRGRAKKPRLSRMDAAIDTMTPLGYSKDLVRKTVQKILKDASSQDERAGDPVSLATIELSTVVGPPCSENINTTSQAANTAEVARNDWKDIVLDQRISQNEILDAAGEKEEFPSGAVDIQYTSVYSPPPILLSNNFVECKGSPLPAEGAQNDWKDIVLDPSSQIHQNEILDAAGEEEELPTGAVNLQNIPPHVLPQQLDDSLPTRRSRPCYRWISDDEDED